MKSHEIRSWIVSGRAKDKSSGIRNKVKATTQKKNKIVF